MEKWEKEAKKIVETGFGNHGDIDFSQPLPDKRLEARLKLEERLYKENKKKKRFYITRFAYACLLVVVLCISGFGVYKLFNKNYVSQDYMFKDTSILELQNDDYCLAYSQNINKIECDTLLLKKSISSLVSKVYDYTYLVYKNGKEYLVVQDNNQPVYYEISLSLSFNEIIKSYNRKFNDILDISKLNDNDYGLLFDVYENGINFYMYEKEDAKTEFLVEF